MLNLGFPLLVTQKINSYLIPEWIEEQMLYGAYLFILEPKTEDQVIRWLNKFFPPLVFGKIARYLGQYPHQTVFCHHTNDYYYERILYFLTVEKINLTNYYLHISYDQYYNYFNVMNLHTTSFFHSNKWKFNEKRLTIEFDPRKIFIPKRKTLSKN